MQRNILRPATAGVAILVTIALVAFNIDRIGQEAIGQMPDATVARDLSDLLLHYAFLPRLAVSLLAGASLGLAGVLFQQVLQNPLAAPDTLAVSSGAQLALVIGVLMTPVFKAEHPVFLAMAGAFVAWGLIALLGTRRRSSTLTLILAGFIASFALGAVASLLVLLNQEYMTSLLIWGAGSLVQTDWEGVWTLGICLLPAIAIVAVLGRSLLIIGLGDQAAGNLGVSLRFAKPLLLALAVLLSASVVAVVGVIGFVGLAAPHLARVLGANAFKSRLIASPLAGAAIFTLVDQVLQAAPMEEVNALPTGAVTALIGAPVLILLLRQLPVVVLEGVEPAPLTARAPDRRLGSVFAVLAALLFATLAVALLVGRGPDGFYFGTAFDTGSIDWRLPRVVGSAAAGLALGVAGCLVQRLFANPMASPEILGIGGGVAVGLVVVLLISAQAGASLQFGGALAGAAVVTALVVILGGHRGFSPERLLLIGIAITALLNATTLLFLALGDPRIGQVLAWLSGSTYRVTPGLAFSVLGVALAVMACAMPLSRWLEILPFGPEVATSMGLPVAFARLVVVALTAMATAAAALIIGPMSFVGLLAPHLAAQTGLRRAWAQLCGAAVVGSALVVFADWIGRVIFAPTELPAGLLAVLIGASIVALASLPTPLRSRME
ncbi:Fe(3+)-hydroxamate ABC transporter permease FhuB [Mesorhizobium sp. ZC-5]|uniref:Fe(3+)-hydroxamate ABC transporter permease FhuB n=1 Tax=Mesorhizobium sp. ZC-5 TaxID=2986066 RepID=UPI0021E9A10D|nr:Fe(3+)-hydroxamate ABC transporter permease FhuB [Mesorhizobium sp. ZC-5]MCV3241762.1 Fe(3+)-hydroxamate ABC transporter permease FhuB [Mesorhizobium sp. ZC-5]